MRRRKGVAVELGVDGHGTDLRKPRKSRFEGGRVSQSLWAVGDHTRVQIAWACLIDYREFADVHVHVGLDRQLPRRLEDGHARLHRTRTTCDWPKIWNENVPGAATKARINAALKMNWPVPTSRPVWKMSTRHRGLLKANWTAANLRGA